MRRQLLFRKKASRIRQATGTAGLEVALRAAVGILSASGIPHLVCGGFAVQEHGYARTTSDVDLIVPDVAIAAELLTGQGFQSLDRAKLLHPETAVHLDLFGAGEVPGKGPVPFPWPMVVTAEPHMVNLQDLVSLKLSGCAEERLQRIRHFSDAVELIKSNGLRRRLKVHAGVREAYEAIRRGLLADGLVG